MKINVALSMAKKREKDHVYLALRTKSNVLSDSLYNGLDGWTNESGQTFRELSDIYKMYGLYFKCEAFLSEARRDSRVSQWEDQIYS